MSTLRVSTIQDTAGSNSSTPAAIANGIAKAWVNFNGTGVVAIRAQYNVSSITDNGTGDYTVNFTNALADANYSSVAVGGNSADGFPLPQNPAGAVPSTSGIRIWAKSPNFGTTDVSYANVAIFR